VAFSDDGTQCVSTGADTKVLIWDLKNATVTRKLEGNGDWGVAATFTPGGQRVRAGGLDKTIHEWDTASGQEVYRYTGLQSVWSMTLTRDNHALSGADDKTVRYWRIPSDTP
jgi:WD40 repeat protein